MLEQQCARIFDVLEAPVLIHGDELVDLAEVQRRSSKEVEEKEQEEEDHHHHHRKASLNVMMKEVKREWERRSGRWKHHGSEHKVERKSSLPTAAGPRVELPRKQSEQDLKHKRGSGSSVDSGDEFLFHPLGHPHHHHHHHHLHLHDLSGPISKTISYIRNKMDTALSTSSLFPAKEEVRQWETSFDSLLNHKYGCALFRQFLKKEFSDENVDFWQECEEFRRMKDGKKSTQQKAHEIYKEYVQEQAPKEVNLDSDTRAATKAAMENGCKTDTFSLAQSRIEQLMAKDSYRRFLKDRLYLDLLDGCEEKEKEQQRKEEQ